jgi:hypothetical protein
VEKVIKYNSNGGKSQTVPIDSHFLVKDHRRGFAGLYSQLSTSKSSKTIVVDFLSPRMVEIVKSSKTIAVDFSSASMMEMLKNIRRLHDLYI